MECEPNPLSCPACCLKVSEVPDSAASSSAGARCCPSLGLLQAAQQRALSCPDVPWMATKDYVSTLQGLLCLRVGQPACQDSSSCTQGAELPSSEVMQGMDLTGLPETVLLSVLDRLSPREVAGNCCLVSHSLRDSALSNDLWRSRFNDLPEVRVCFGIFALFVASWWDKIKLTEDSSC